MSFTGTSRFEVRHRLGSGAFGTVYEAYDREQGRQIAIKVLRRTDPEFLLRFKREFRRLDGFRHPHLVELYELISESRWWFFTMELVHGVEFLRYVEHRPRPSSLTAPPACDIDRLRQASRQLAEGMSALHRAGILHCDIKPRNILVAPDGWVRLLDFGLVHEADATAPQTVIAGTPGYMSPEQAFGLPLGPASDWYSFGMTLFQALTGGLPERRTGSYVRGGPAGTAPVLPRGGAADLYDLCLSLLRDDPADRPSETEIMGRLGESGATVTAPRPPASPLHTLIGRQPHLDRLAALLERSTHGDAVVVNITGKSGIGKSSLVRAFRQRLTQAGPDVVVLSGRCHETETVPYKALDDLIDGLSRYLGSLPEHEAAALAPRDAPYLARLFPVVQQVRGIDWTGRRPTAGAPQEMRERAFSSFQDLLARIGEKRHLVLIIDDLQWGDLDSAAFLGRLLLAPSSPGLLLVASFRSEDVESSPFLKAWKATLAGARALVVEDLTVGALSTAESTVLARQRLADQSSIGLLQADAIVAESGGSPFLIDQLATYAASAGSVASRTITLGTLVTDRIAKLPAAERALLETLALAGRPLSHTVAAAAAGLEGSASPAVAELVAKQLARVRETSARKEVEVYHDRLRETIANAITPDRRQARHLALAAAYAREDTTDEAVLALHFEQGGNLPEAAKHWLAAADRTADALAFDRAVQFYRTALQLSAHLPVDVAGVKRRLATALVNGGRGPEAADVYLEAAAEAARPLDVDLKRLAAEQLLRSGHTEEGLALLRGLASEVGIRMTKEPWHAAVSLLWHGLRITARGLHLRRGPSPSNRQKHLMVLDLYWSLAVGLGVVDIIRSFDFQARHLLLALQVGDRPRAARSLAANAVALCGSRGRDSGASRKLQAEARLLAEQSGDPQVLGFVAVMSTLGAVMRGQWREAAHHSASADRQLRDTCTGMGYERSLNLGLGITAAYFLGEWQRLVTHKSQLPGLVQEARTRGDLHTLHFLLNCSPVANLVRDQPDPERELFAEVCTGLPRDGYFLPQLLEMFGQCDSELYQRNAAGAWAIVDAAWPALSGSLLLRLRYLAIVAWQHRAQAAVAMAAASDGARRHYLREATQAAREIDRKPMPFGGGISLLIRASVASFDADRRVARDLLEKASRHLEDAQMSHLVAVCNYRRGQLIGGEDGHVLIAGALSWSQRVGVVDFTRIADMLVPGSWSSSAADGV